MALSTWVTGTTTGTTMAADFNAIKGYVTSTAGYLPYSLGEGFTYSASLSFNGTFLKVGSGTALSGATNPLVAMVTSSSTGYVQSYVQNTAAGTSASSDMICYPNNGTDAAGWVDVGITSTTFADAAYTVTGANESYLFSSALSATYTGNLVLATSAAGSANAIQLYTGGFTQAKTAYKFQIDSAGNVYQKPPATPPTLTVNGDMVFNLTSNTNLRISVRGSDGVTRVANITLA
jgi:hypothetical protein